MAVSITFANLWVPSEEDGDTRRSVADLTSPDDHIHGLLSIRIGEKVLPHLGYFGPDDVCIGAWVAELNRAVEELSRTEHSEYVYDEGEQGQPAFRFARHGDEIEVSVIDSQVDGKGDPDWGTQVCGFAEFCHEVEAFQAELRRRLDEEAPDAGKKWQDQWLR
jgi:hypothetical protein